MTASALRDWVAIFMMDYAPDGAGGAIETVPPGLVADTPANVARVSPRQVVASDQIADRIVYTVTIRFQDWVTVNYRVMFNDQYLDITGIKDVDQLGIWLELTCERFEAGAQ